MKVIEIRESIQSQVQVGDRIRWSSRGDTDFGRVTKINRRTFVCANGSNKHPYKMVVDKELVFEIVRWEHDGKIFKDIDLPLDGLPVRP